MGCGPGAFFRLQEGQRLTRFHQRRDKPKVETRSGPWSRSQRRPDPPLPGDGCSGRFPWRSGSGHPTGNPWVSLDAAQDEGGQINDTKPSCSPNHFIIPKFLTPRGFYFPPPRPRLGRQGTIGLLREVP